MKSIVKTQLLLMLDPVYIYDFVALIASFVCGLLTIPVVLDFCKERGLLDIPNFRKVHKKAIPRLGGVVFVPSMIVGVLIVMVMNQLSGQQVMSFSLWTLYFFLGLITIYFTGLVDDLTGLRARTKLFIQLLAAVVLPLSGLYINNLQGFLGIYEIPFWLGAPLTTVVVAFICNSINLIDGIDGLCAGLTLIALGGFYCAFKDWGLDGYCVLIAALIGVLVAYLYFNLFGDESKNRKIFMGDTGSLSLGFLLAFLGLKLSMVNDSIVTFNGNGLLISFSLLIVPIFDVFRVAIVRMRHHRSPMVPDKNHIHHKLMRIGLKQSQALVAILVMVVGFIMLNLLLQSVGVGLTVIVCADIVLYILFHLGLDVVLRRAGQPAHLFEA